MAATALVLAGCGPSEQNPEPDLTVTHVVDGDTVVLSTGDRVRLIGIDAPEKGRCGAARATAFLARMVANRHVTVTNPKEVVDRDRHGRSLAYIGTRRVEDAGYRLVRRGLARPRYNSTDGYDAHPAEHAYAEAARRAKRFSCKPKARPRPTTAPEPSAPRWTCSLSTTYDRNWHNDVLCTNGTDTDRPNLRPGDSFITEAEIMESAREHERQLNGGR